MGHVVVGVDGSEASEQALGWAAEEAALRSATLDVVCAYSVPAGWLGMGDAMGTVLTTPVAVEDLEKYARHLVERAADVAQASHPGLDIEKRVELGHPATVLLDASKGASLLVVGTRGRGDIGSILLGSVGLHCVHHASCPVVVVRGDGESR